MSLPEAAGFGFLLGLGSSAHCAAMCGVFAVRAGSAGGEGSGWLRFPAYILGKTFTYIFLGAAAGWAGGALTQGAVWAQTALGIIAGLALIPTALRHLRQQARPSRLGRALTEFLSPLLPSLRNLRGGGGAFALGAVTGALPCGVVYLGALQGASLGRPLEAVALMAALGLSTVPVLAVLGFLGRQAGARWERARRIRLAGGILLLAGAGVMLVRAALPWWTGTTAEGGPCFH